MHAIKVVDLSVQLRQFQPSRNLVCAGTMNTSDSRFWPFRKSLSGLCTVMAFLGILTSLLALRKIAGWPNEQSDRSLIVGLIALSGIPVLLALLDLFMERGGGLKYGGFEINIASAERMSMRGVSIPANFGVQGQAVTDSSTTEILKTLTAATLCDVAILDLEEGQAWWETRLLVLLAGAERLKRPQKVVFVGSQAGKPKQFLGWAHPDELLCSLRKSDEKYRRCLLKARAAGRQWDLLEPLDPVPPMPGAIPNAYPWMVGGLAMRHPWWGFEQTTGLPNEFFVEQLLADELGRMIESQQKPRTLSVGRLIDLFDGVLVKERLDLRWSSLHQREEFFCLRSQYVAITSDNQYQFMVAKVDVMAEILKTI